MRQRERWTAIEVDLAGVQRCPKQKVKKKTMDESRCFGALGVAGGVDKDDVGELAGPPPPPREEKDG